MISFDASKYSNHKHAFDQISHQSNKVLDLLIAVGIDYSGKITGSLKMDELIPLRNSASFRLQSILFHYRLLASINISGEKRPARNFPGPTEGISTNFRQGFLFDSIVFHSMSFFDYLSCLISFITFGRQKLQWQALANHSRSNNQFKETGLAISIDNTDRYFVTKLNSYRGDLIHYKEDNQGFSQSLDLMGGKLTIDISAPKNFKQVFKKELAAVDEKEITMNSISLWHIDVLTSESIKIINDLLEYIEMNRKVPKGKEVITRNKSKND